MRTQVGFAKWLGVSADYVIRIENGYPMPEVFARRLAEKIGVEWRTMRDPKAVPMVPERPVGFVPAFGADARAMRDELKMSEQEYAEMLGVTVELVREWEAKPARATPPPHPPRPYTADDFRRFLGRPGPDNAEPMTEALKADLDGMVAGGAREAAALLAAAASRGRLGLVLADLHEIIGTIATRYDVRPAFLRELKARQGLCVR